MSYGKPRKPIIFHEGLNTVLGGQSADNSIGKSTFLLIIDYVFGGDTYKYSDAAHKLKTTLLNLLLSLIINTIIFVEILLTVRRFLFAIKTIIFKKLYHFRSLKIFYFQNTILIFLMLLLEMLSGAISEFTVKIIILRKSLSTQPAQNQLKRQSLL